MYATQPQDPLYMTEAEYLAFEEASETRHEYSRGKIYAMTGGSLRHSILIATVITQLGIQLADRNCTVTSPDTRVHITSKGTYRYPDVTVFCGDPVYLEDRTDTILNPVVLVEVTSPSTALKDRNEKLLEYLQIETLQAYLLVSQHEPLIERYLRHESGDWLYSIARGLDSNLSIPGIDCTLPLAKVYQKVTFDEPDPDAEQHEG